VTDKLEIHELAARYADLCDRGDWPAVVALYTENGVFDAKDTYGRVATGHDDLLDFYRSFPVAIAHHPTSVHSTIDGERATARMKMLVLFRAGLFSVNYTWQLRVVAGEWKIAHQAIGVQGKLDVPKPAPA
jgi:ketosteroid isomerase-like protein